MLNPKGYLMYKPFVEDFNNIVKFAIPRQSKNR
jgi:hypothetical protein